MTPLEAVVVLILRSARDIRTTGFIHSEQLARLKREIEKANVGNVNVDVTDFVMPPE